MAITRVQHKGTGHGGSGGFGAQAVTLDSAVTRGNLIVVWWFGNSNTGNATCSDNIGTTYTALTQQTPITGSGRRCNWFWGFAGSSATPTVTVTPNANAGNSEFVHVIEYSGVGAIDSAVTAFAQQSTASTSWSQASGTPSVTGDLILYGVCFDNDIGTHTVSATSGITSVMAGGGGTSGSTLAMAVGELIGASTSAVTCVMGIGNSDEGGKYVVGFRAASALTKTQTATARIANTRTKTQTATANIQVANVSTKTQTATARIAATVTKTQSATARIAVILTKTQSAVARISNSFTKTQSATARIANTKTKTQTAKAAISQSGTETQTAKARISTTSTKTQAAKARIANNLYKQQTATAKIVQTIFYFTPPVEQGPSRFQGRVRERLWRHYRGQPTGITILKVDGEYIEVSTPTQRQVAAADVAYLGGHVAEITADEAAALQAAGYEITTGVNG